jgi:hypothetical protein
MTIYVVCRMAYKAALIFCILLLSFPAKVGGMFSLIIVMAYVDIIISNRHHITEILLKVALNTNKQTNTFFFI